MGALSAGAAQAAIAALDIAPDRPPPPSPGTDAFARWWRTHARRWASRLSARAWSEWRRWWRHELGAELARFDAAGGMMSDLEARDVVRQAFAARELPAPTMAELQGVQAIGRFEGMYGSGIKGATNNWGAVHCNAVPPCPEDCAPGKDSHPDGQKYAICFRVYADPVAGAADMLRELYRRKGVPEAMKAGDALAVAHAMHKARYFEAPPKLYAQAIERNAAKIAKSLGEPHVMVRGGGKVQPPADDDGGGGALLLWLGLGTVVAWRTLR